MSLRSSSLFGLGKRGHEAIVIAHLVDELLALGELRQAVAGLRIEPEGFLAEHMQAALEGGLHHLGVVLGGCRNDQTIERLFREHSPVIGVRPDARVFCEHVENIAGGVTDRPQRDFWMGIDDGMMGQAHLP